MSAALTNEDSCLDGFQVAKGRVKAMVTGRVHYLSKLISNALALVNTFAGNLIDVRHQSPQVVL
jgi:pectinesterase inhibitor-like protein